MMKLKQIKTIIAFMLMGLPMRRQHRKFFAKWGGKYNYDSIHWQKSII